MYFGDGSFFILIGLMLLASVASMRVKSTFNKYHKVRNVRGLTGAQAAEMMLRQNGVNDVRIERVNGYLSDHYDPRAKVIRLSEPVYDNPSVASVSVACHEAGHALQHAMGYTPLKLRTAILPAAQLGTKALWPLFFAGIILSMPPLITFGIIFFSFSVLFQLITLPVEFNASSRALKIMDESGILAMEENVHAKKVLNAAAMTYVAAAAMAIGQLVRMILLNRGRD
ncbi:zinc metallopeptidase [Fusibacter tunisiensis]|uniref:Zn-dependent membrane protease YugP n=1 Tax=Fusibacter tunisiensis TaxID=1008308 RepID=A0ABS2MMI7_9FIRM|nr:zinc metallopeptidase [Fusibacter tunisiensis]MBM7560537.1 Zn-dependent membrane protease YugP [Fusibacter tunisiensis]